MSTTTDHCCDVFCMPEDLPDLVCKYVEQYVKDYASDLVDRKLSLVVFKGFEEFAPGKFEIKLIMTITLEIEAVIIDVEETIIYEA